MHLTRPFFRRFARLRRDTSGVALIEFAYGLPILVALSLTGLETAHLAMSKLRLAQLARLAADNTARYSPAVSLTDVDDIISGVKKAGASIKFAQNGRIIISSLQLNAAGNGQWINWQRCAGAKVYNSSYGTDDQGFVDATIQGMGPAGSQISSPNNRIYVIFVELAYNYQPLITNNLLGTQVLKTSQAFIVRSRTTGNINGAYTVDSGGNYIRSNGATGTRTNTVQGNTIANCSTYSA